MTHETHECVCVCNDEQVRITGTTVEWDEMRFDVRLLQRVPYEGISRMQTSLRRRHRDRVVRYAACLFAMPSHTMSETNGG